MYHKRYALNQISSLVLKSSLLIVVILFPFLSFGQKKAEIDSLTNLLTNAKISVDRRVDILNTLGTKFAKTDSAKTYYYALQASHLAEKSNYTKGIADASRSLGVVQSQKNHAQAALVAYNTALQLYVKINDAKFVGLIYNDIGIVYLRIQNNKEMALEYFFKAEAVHRKGNYTDELLADLNALGVVYSDDNKPKSIQYYIEAAALADKMHKPGILPQLYINIGKLLYEDKNYAAAKEYYLKAINLLSIANEQIDLGIAELNLANVYVDQLNYKQADIAFTDALTAFTKSNFTRGVQVCYNNLGAMAIRQGKYHEAISFLEKSLNISETSKNYSGIALTQQNIALAYMKLGQLAKAEELYNVAEKSAIKYKNNISVFGEIYNHRSMLDSATGNYKSAFIARNKYLQIKDSLLNEKLSKQINELNTKYETEKKQKQIELLNRQNTIQSLSLQNKSLEIEKNKGDLFNASLEVEKDKLQVENKQSLLNKKQLESEFRGQKIKLLNKQSTIQQLQLSKKNMAILIIGGVFLLFMVISYLFYNRYKLKQEAVLQLEVIRQQDMATKGIIEAEERERKRIAGELHDGVGQLFTTVKMNMEILMERFLIRQPDADILAEKTMAMVDESCVEVRSIAHQMMPNALIKSGLVSALRDFINKIPSEKLKISLETKGIDNGLESTTETVLYRVIQESVNNVIKHAQATALDILLLCDKKEITVSIEDNGKGFNTDDKSKFTGIGLKNMISRVEFLKGSVDISSSPGKGTLVAIFIPNNQ
jgi:two-component system NarL family sensor kinase